jgi:hypothetical protein
MSPGVPAYLARKFSLLLFILVAAMPQIASIPIGLAPA